MMPGRMNSREVRRMMAQMGIKSTDMTDIKKIIMEGTQKNYVIENPQVTLIEAQGEKYFQIAGAFKETTKTTSTEPVLPFTEEDIKLVIEQTRVDRAKAIEALKKTGGEVAQAIIDLSSK